MAHSATHASFLSLLLPIGYVDFIVREHALLDRPHTILWLAKTYGIPADMYGSRIWVLNFCRRGVL
jgi:hypothetical protein